MGFLDNAVNKSAPQGSSLAKPLLLAFGALLASGALTRKQAPTPASTPAPGTNPAKSQRDDVLRDRDHWRTQAERLALRGPEPEKKPEKMTPWSWMRWRSTG
jgi:hypothetical protein